MRNTPKNLNEEIMKMRKLMNFNISENSHNVLSENVINESVITENQLKSLHVEQETTQEYSDQFLENWLLKRLDDSSPIWWNSKHLIIRSLWSTRRSIHPVQGPSSLFNNFFI